MYIREIQGRTDRIVFLMYEKARINPARIPDLLECMGKDMAFKKAEPVQFVYHIQERSGRQEKDLLKLTAQILDKMKVLLE